MTSRDEALALLREARELLDWWQGESVNSTHAALMKRIDALLAASEGEQTMAGAEVTSHAGVPSGPAPAAPDTPTKEEYPPPPEDFGSHDGPNVSEMFDVVHLREQVQALERQRDTVQSKLDAAQELANRETLSAAYWKAKAAQSATPASAIVEAVNELLDAEEMQLHNQAIFKGKWKKGQKAWSGEYLERKVIEAMVKLRALLRPTANTTKGEG